MFAPQHLPKKNLHVIEEVDEPLLSDMDRVDRLKQPPPEELYFEEEKEEVDSDPENSFYRFSQEVVAKLSRQGNLERVNQNSQQMLEGKRKQKIISKEKPQKSFDFSDDGPAEAFPPKRRSSSLKVEQKRLLNESSDSEEKVVWTLKEGHKIPFVGPRSRVRNNSLANAQMNFNSRHDSLNNDSQKPKPNPCARSVPQKKHLSSKDISNNVRASLLKMLE